MCLVSIDFVDHRCAAAISIFVLEIMIPCYGIDVRSWNLQATKIVSSLINETRQITKMLKPYVVYHTV